MLRPNNREACWEDSMGKIFSSCESIPLWKPSPASPAGRLTAPNPLLPLSHAQDEMAAFDCGTSAPHHPWPTAWLDSQLGNSRWRQLPKSHSYLRLQERWCCTAHSHFYWGREKDTSTKTQNLLYVTMTKYSSFGLAFWFFWEILILIWLMRPWVIQVPRWGSIWKRGDAEVSASSLKHLETILTL